MEFKDILNLIEIETRFNTECKQVCNALIAYKRDYKYMDSFYIEQTQDTTTGGIDYTIHCTGIYHKDNEYIEVKGFFPVKCLSMDSTELRGYVEDRILDRVETELYEINCLDKGTAEAEYKLYLKLKEKYDVETELE